MAKIKRHELWRKQYRFDRYMKHLSDQELKQRARDIFVNQLVLTNDNKIGLHPIDGEGEYWVIIFTHLLEEFVLRFGPYPAGFTDGFIQKAKIPDPRHESAEKACAAARKVISDDGKYLFRLSKKKYLSDTYHKGLIRISPAASYDDPSLNHAIQDDELIFVSQPNMSHYTLNVNDGESGEFKGTVKPQNFQIRHTATTNYYVLCMSSALTPRLFLDFDADACLIIKKPNVFIHSILESFAERRPDWYGGPEIVEYVDPLKPSLEKVDVFKTKHFRYSYQKEVRLVWLPPNPQKELEHQEIEIGSIESYTEFITL